jgi:DNA polymerase III delta prime subunit
MTAEIWVEKYRPKVLEDVVIDAGTLEIFKNFIEQKTIPHLLFCGSAGLGKTTCAKILARAITEDAGDVLYINASDETSIEIIRGKVKSFCSTTSFSGGLKIVILDEFDGMSGNAMMMLRNTMEEFASRCRFILTCNHSERVIEPIKSRTQTFDFSGTEKKLIAKKCVDILTAEKIDYASEKENLKTIVNKYYPDIRKIINCLQQFSTSGTFKYNENRAETAENQDKLIAYIKKCDIKAIVKELLGSGVDYSELYRTIFDRAEELVGTDTEKKINVMLLTADFLHKHSMVIDPEINFRALLINICRVL